jgi:diguanylate cyclase (GGDEF)-like protein
MIDNETGLIKEDIFYYLADFEVRRSKRYLNFSTLLLIEPDYDFKNGLDLKIIARILKEEFRDTDIIGRINHFRFGIMLPYADNKLSFFAGERVRKTIGNYVFTEKKKVTISIGGACFPTNGNERNELVSLAEHMLKKAKDEGGDHFYLP